MASQPHPIIEAFLLTDVGRKRQQNEDFVGHFVPDDVQELAADGQLYIVADGVGGAAAGDVASQHAVEKVLYEYFESDEPDLDQRLVDAIRAANMDLYEYAVSGNQPKMATTLVAALVRGSDLHIANVGDSRAYLVRGSAIRQITQDHTLVDQLVAEGAITPEEARDHPNKSLLLRSLGGESTVAVDIFTGHLRSGDAVVLCSDGLTRHVDDEEIGESVSTLTGEDACRQLVALANERGGEDNISVIVLHYDPLTPALASETVIDRPDVAPQPSPVRLEPAADAPSLPEKPSRSAAESLQDLAGKPQTLTDLPEPVSLGERLTSLPWRDIALGAGALVAGIAVVLALGFWLPSLGVRLGGPPADEVSLPATTVSSTAASPTEETEVEAPLPTDEEPAGVGESTAVPVTVTPTVVPTLNPNLTGPVEVLEGEFRYGATPLQTEQALALCEELGGTCTADFFTDAEPSVRVQLNTFYIDRTEVTNSAYKACVDAGSCAQPEGLNAEGLGIGDYYLNEANQNYPVVGVTWSQADTYCRWAGGRLPSEAEWEKAASWDSTNLDKRVWPWGQNWDATQLNVRNPETPVGGPEPVGTRPGNVSPYGALDMAGNVAEWVADWYADDYYETLAGGQLNPPGPPEPGEQAFKVMRGGSWETNGVFARTIHRLLALQDHSNKSIGFRCAYDVDPQPTPSPGAGASDAPPLISGDQPAESTATPAAQ